MKWNAEEHIVSLIVGQHFCFNEKQSLSNAHTAYNKKGEKNVI